MARREVLLHGAGRQTALVTVGAPTRGLRLALRGLGLAILVVAAIGGCSPDTERSVGTDSSSQAGSFDVEHRVIVDGLLGPTQVVAGADGRLWVATINGGENDRQGQVLVFDDDDMSEPLVILDGLDKPTGLALFAGELWVMERDRLTRGPIDGSEREVVIDDLPSNGRSEGALTVDGDRLLFDTSGAVRDGEVVADSARLWTVDATGTITEVASGFKHAYAQARAADRTLFTTEIGDGSYDGAPPDDEVVAVSPGVDHGWPRCVGDNIAVVEYDGTDAACAELPPSHAVFAPGATPTSIVTAPWDDDVLLVALWNASKVVALRVSTPGAGPIDVFTEVEHPQHLAADGDRVLLTDHLAGTIIELTAVGAP